jgi:DNA repair protein RecO (recombination protein O)
MSTLVKTEGIVLNHVLYRETSAIVHLYTRELGRQNYIINGVWGNRKNRKNVLLQPFNRLALQVYYSPRKDLQRIKEFLLHSPLMNIPYHQGSRAQVFFLTELLSRILIVQEAAPDLYDFLDQSVDLLDSKVEGGENAHLFILFRLTRFLGFYPNENKIGLGTWFDMKNGVFAGTEPAHGFFLAPEKAVLFARLFDVDVFQLKKIARNAFERQVILNALLDFYRLHTPGFGELRSLSVLQSVLHV